MAHKALYRGDDEHFLPGVPRRHLTDEDYAALDAETRARVDASPLYRLRVEPPAPGDAAPAARPSRSPDSK